MKSIYKAVLIVILSSVPLIPWRLPSKTWAGPHHYGLGFHFGSGHHRLGLHLGHGHHHGHRHHHGYHHHRHYSHHYRPYYYYPYPFHSYRYGYPHSYYSHGTSESNYGWDLLRNDRPDEALRAFGLSAQASPSRGAPKVGYALAAAELGQLKKGVWAMRRALRFDPDSLHYVALDQALRSKVEHLVNRYGSSREYITKDIPFMLGALYYLLGDLDRAQDAIGSAMIRNDYAISTQNLRRLIERDALG